MNNCHLNSKKACSNCPNLYDCDRAKVCDGNCNKCDITDCENNLNKKEN